MGYYKDENIYFYVKMFSYRDHSYSLPFGKILFRSLIPYYLDFTNGNRKAIV